MVLDAPPQGQLQAGSDALVKDVPLLQQALSVHVPHALQATAAPSCTHLS
jgi:hypothetical protein